MSHWRQVIAIAIVIKIIFVLQPALGLAGSRQEEIVSQHGVVAADDGRCSRVGRDVLKEGGHAVDAAVAVALCLGVVSPASSGIAGGAFMLLRLSNGKAQAFDMRETAPLMSSEVNYYVQEFEFNNKYVFTHPIVRCLLFIEHVWRQCNIESKWSTVNRSARRSCRTS